MARSIKWPPIVTDGRTEEVIGSAATAQVVAMTMRSHASQPYVSRTLYLNDLPFRSPGSNDLSYKAAIEAKLQRLRSLASNITVTVERTSRTKRTVHVRFLDKETTRMDGVTADV
jgi:hypothetical protein